MDLTAEIVSPDELYKDNEFITLVSYEGFEFIVSKRVASGSKMLKEMMQADESGPFGPIDRVPLPDISARVLEIICEYLCERRMRGVYLSSFEPLLQLDPTKEGDRELAIELLLAANYMDC